MLKTTPAGRQVAGASQPPRPFPGQTSGCRTSANAQQPLLWTCPEVGPLQSDVLVAADVCCSLLPRRGPLVARGQQTPVAAKLAAGADASRTRRGWEQPSALPVAGAHRGVTGVGTGGAAECSALSSN